MLFNYCIHSRGKYNKDIGSMPLLLCGGRVLHDGLSMTEVYTNCTALFIVHRRTQARCKYHFDLGLIGCEISEFRFHPIGTTRFLRPAPGFSIKFSNTSIVYWLHPKPSRMHRGSVNTSFCHVIRARNELIRSVEHLVQH